MKTSHFLPLGGLIVLSLSGCKPADNSAADEARRQLEASQAAYAQQAADMQQRSEDLQKQLLDLQRAVQDKENAELKARLESIQQENARLLADAEAARKKSDQLRDELAKTPVPAAPPYVPGSPVSQPWVDPDADYSMFYDSLSPHGRWVDVDGYGYAFRPAYSDRSSWRPYVDGSWAWTEQGWAWDSNEPFGWATYHYGRWVKVNRHGWLWIPGRQWAPAWVSWRSGSDYVGWAPLPPSASYGSIGHDCDTRYGLAPSSYVFINASNFGRGSYLNVSLSISSVTNFFAQTINVTNIVQVPQRDICIQRGGPALDWVEKRTGSRVVRAPVQVVRHLERPVEFRQDRDRPNFIAAPMPSGRADRGRGRGPAPRVVSERISQPVIVDAWKDVPDNKRDDLRRTVDRQSKQPQPKPVIADVPRLPETLTEQPRQPDVPGRPGRRPGDTQPEVRPGVPVPNVPNANVPNFPNAPQIPDRFPGRDREPGKGRPGPGKMPDLQITQDAANKAELARRAAEGRMQEAQAEREKQLAAQQQELARRQAEAAAMQQQIAEQEKKAQEARAEQEALMKQRQEEAQKAREAAMAAQEAAGRENEGRERDGRRPRGGMPDAGQRMEEARQQAEQQASQQRQSAMQAQQQAQEEMTRRQQDMIRQREEQQAAMKAAQEENLRRQQESAAAMKAQQQAEAQREAAQRAAQENAMKAQQEMAERQHQAELQRQQQEANMQAQREAAMKAQQEAAERQRQQEAAMQAQREAAERQREAAMQAQREAAERAQREANERAQQEAMRRAQEEAERQREAMRQQEEARRQAEEAARRANEKPPGQ